VRFDPHYIPGEDAPLTASGEIDLPDDLLELAAQLQDDAAYLAEKYPAAGAEKVNVYVAPAAKRSALRWVAVAGFVSAALLLAVVVAPRSSNMHVGVPEHVAVATPAAPVSDVITDPPASPSGSRTVRLPWAPTPAIGEVTGPELEGLLDLWQNDEQPGETRISI